MCPLGWSKDLSHEELPHVGSRLFPTSSKLRLTEQGELNSGSQLPLHALRQVRQLTLQGLVEADGYGNRRNFQASLYILNVAIVNLGKRCNFSLGHPSQGTNMF